MLSLSRQSKPAVRSLGKSLQLQQRRFIDPRSSHVKDVKRQKEVDNIRENSFKRFQLWEAKNTSVFIFLGIFVGLTYWVDYCMRQKREYAFLHDRRLREEGTALEYMRADEEMEDDE